MDIWKPTNSKFPVAVCWFWLPSAREIWGEAALRSGVLGTVDVTSTWAELIFREILPENYTKKS